MNKKIVIAIGALTYFLSSYFSYAFFAGQTSGLKAPSALTSRYSVPADKSGNVVIDENAPKTEQCPLNGEKLTRAHRKLWEGRRVLGVMIENHTEARPQSGLTSADVIYEAVAEGGITRFLAIFYCKDSESFIGPIRSARIYFVELMQSYGRNPLYTHVGGANCNKATGSGCKNGAPADALGALRDLGWKGYNDLDHVAFPVMFRDYERLSRVTEHTVYSTTKKLWDYAARERGLSNVDEKGRAWDKGFKTWRFKDDEPATSPLTDISFNFWEKYGDYAVRWVYDAQNNSFQRTNGGQPHTDLNNKKQIESKNVIVVFMEESVAKDGYDKGQHLLYQTTGQGGVLVFRDGQAIEGTWKRADEETLIRFYDKSGKEIELNRGQVFIEIVPEGNKVSY